MNKHTWFDQSHTSIPNLQSCFSVDIKFPLQHWRQTEHKAEQKGKQERKLCSDKLDQQIPKEQPVWSERYWMGRVHADWWTNSWWTRKTNDDEWWGERERNKLPNLAETLGVSLHDLHKKIATHCSASNIVQRLQNGHISF